jgi:delta14-sterol reductase/lamin-B receptor
MGKQVHYEFGGPLGAISIIIGLPFAIYLLYYLCPNEPDQPCGDLAFLEKHAAHVGVSVADLLSGRTLSLSQLSDAMVTCATWTAFHAAMYQLIPGPVFDGAQLRTGARLKYPINGHRQFWITLFVLNYGNPKFGSDGSFQGFGSYDLGWCYDNFVALASASIIWASVLSVLLYVASFRPGTLLAEGGDTGSAVYDFFIGRELNPRFRGTIFDAKFFCELRPGLIGLVALNMGMAQKQKELHGEYSWEMLSINVFQGLYVWDALYHERSVLTTMDITTDGFGFMLVFGDLCWVPFTYGIQARYLVHRPGLDSVPLLMVVWMLNFLGYCMFRGANGEKDAFRTNPNSPASAHLQYIDTARGTRLLVSGWWGMARKINYTADWLMGLAWCLVTGFHTVLTYFYTIYFTILLIHRALRDDDMCQKKYGDDWNRYKQKVPYWFIPGII